MLNRSSAVGDVIRESRKWLAINDDDYAAQLRKNRRPKWPALEQAITIWLEKLLLGNQESTLLQNLIDRLPYNEKLTYVKEASLHKIVGRILFNVIIVY